jgi:competence protein ComEA
MKINTEPVRSWFGYSRKERRASFVLLIILFVIIIVRYFVPEKNVSINEFPVSQMEIGRGDENYSEDNNTNSQALSFDPNTASYDTLLRLGLDSKTASTLISYRNKGGKFRIAQDIKKVYGISDAQAGKLIPLVEVASDTSTKTKSTVYQKQNTPIDLNSCDSSILISMPGIGPVLSVRIIRYRKFLGGFARKAQLKEVYGLPEETYNLIEERVFVDSLAIKRIKVNLAEYTELRRLPYLEKYEVTAILKYRELKGRISGVAELVKNKLITDETAFKVRPYMDFE